jgi:hypothetical protein
MAKKSSAAKAKKKITKTKTKNETAGNGIGHNRVPSEREMRGFFSRLDRLHDDMAVAAANIRTDIKSVYSEASSKLGVTKAAFKRHYGRYKQERAFEAWLADQDERVRDDNDRLMVAAAKAFGDTPFGRYCESQATARGASESAIEENEQADLEDALAAAAAGDGKVAEGAAQAGA